MKPVFQGRLTAGQAVLDLDLRDLQIIDGPSGPILYAATGQNGGISAYDVNEGALASSLPGKVFFSPADVGLGVGTLVDADTGTGPKLLLGSGPGHSLIGYDLHANGGFGSKAETGLPSGSGGTISGVATAYLTDGRMAHYVLDANSGKLGSYVENANGELDVISDAQIDALETQKGASIHDVQSGGSRYVVVAGSGWSGPGSVTSYRVDPATGALEQRDISGAVDGLGINTPTTMATVSANGTAWVVVGDGAAQSLSVLRLGADGSLTPTDYLLDTQETRFGNVQSVAMLETDGRIFVVAGGGDDGFTLFTLLPNGHLLQVATLAQAPGRGLRDVTALEIVRVGDELQIFAAGEGAPGISQFRVSLKDLGQVKLDQDPEAQTVIGTGGDDLIVATGETSSAGARDRLEGGAGDDILVSGGDGSDMHGGTGADVFVVTEGQHHILDFNPAKDALDVSGLPYLYSPLQLDHDVIPDGIVLRHNGTEIRITSADASPLTLADLWPGNRFDTANHFPVGLQAPGAPINVSGSDNADTIEGTWANEIFTLGAGSDAFVLMSNSGADTITDFNPTEDRLDFSKLDTVQQAALTSVQVGSTRIITFGDSSTLKLTGVDVNSAPQGTASVAGWLGTGQSLQAKTVSIQDADGIGTAFTYQWLRNGVEISGATAASYRLKDSDAGAQFSVRVNYMDGLGTWESVESQKTSSVSAAWRGNNLNNVMQGKSSVDFIEALGGNDVVFGNKGNDAIFGGYGNDKLYGQWGQDYMVGGRGNDRLLGGQGADRLDGGDDHDFLSGEDGNDELFGGSGNDVLHGGIMHDTLDGQRGNDSLNGWYGSDILRGGDGHDKLYGSFGVDQLFGDAGNDLLQGGGGNDKLWGGRGDDILKGGPANDLLHGEQDNDELRGGNGDDSLWGGEGRDRLFGQGGNDQLFGDHGDDFLAGKSGVDTLWGGSGNDILIGGLGDDILHGGSGADEFRFVGNHMNDTISDFEPGQDTISLVGLAKSYDALTIEAREGDAFIILSTGIIHLEGVAPDQLSADDFLFL